MEKIQTRRWERIVLPEGNVINLQKMRLVFIDIYYFALISVCSSRNYTPELAYFASLALYQELRPADYCRTLVKANLQPLQ